MSRYQKQTGDANKIGDWGLAIAGEPLNCEHFTNFSKPGIVDSAESEKKILTFVHALFLLNTVQAISRMKTLDDYSPIMPVTI